MSDEKDMAEVLIVDDNSDARDMVQFALEQEGIESTQAADGYEALTALEEDHDIKLVLLDLSMPILDGLTVAEEIRANEKLHPNDPNVKIAFLTARSVNAVDVRVGNKTDVEQPFLLKDGNLPNIIKKVKKWLGRE